MTMANDQTRTGRSACVGNDGGGTRRRLAKPGAGVIRRALKPAHGMAGAFGKGPVMDWGLA